MNFCFLGYSLRNICLPSKLILLYIVKHCLYKKLKKRMLIQRNCADELITDYDEEGKDIFISNSFGGFCFVSDCE